MVPIFYEFIIFERQRLEIFICVHWYKKYELFRALERYGNLPHILYCFLIIDSSHISVSIRINKELWIKGVAHCRACIFLFLHILYFYFFSCTACVVSRIVVSLIYCLRRGIVMLDTLDLSQKMNIQCSPHL